MRSRQTDLRGTVGNDRRKELRGILRVRPSVVGVRSETQVGRSQRDESCFRGFEEDLTVTCLLVG